MKMHWTWQRPCRDLDLVETALSFSRRSIHDPATLSTNSCRMTYPTAYFFLVAEAMIDTGVHMGFSRPVATVRNHLIALHCSSFQRPRLALTRSSLLHVEIGATNNARIGTLHASRERPSSRAAQQHYQSRRHHGCWTLPCRKERLSCSHCRFHLGCLRTMS